MTLDPTWIKGELDAIKGMSTRSHMKGRRFEKLLRLIFEDVPGLTHVASDTQSAHHTQEIDLTFWNDKPPNGLFFLDVPLLIEGKSSSSPVDGRDFEHFATTVKHRGRRDGVLVALGGLTGNPGRNSAGLYHQATALIDGITILVVTEEDLLTLTSGADLVRLCQRLLLAITLRQVQQKVEKAKIGKSTKAPVKSKAKAELKAAAPTKPKDAQP